MEFGIRKFEYPPVTKEFTRVRAMNLNCDSKTDAWKWNVTRVLGVGELVHECEISTPGESSQHKALIAPSPQYQDKYQPSERHVASFPQSQP